MENIGTRTLIIVVAGYAFLLSYTLPYGFVPLVSLQSLPLVLVGSALIVFAMYIFLCFLFLPFIFFTKEYVIKLIEDEFGSSFIEITGSRELTLENIEKFIKNFPILMRILALSWVVLLIAFILLASFFAWYFLSRGFQYNKLTLILIAYFYLWPTFKTLSGLLKARSLITAIYPAIGCAFFIILLPSLLFSPPKGYFGSGPNIIVKSVLRVVNAGAEIAIDVNGSNAEGSNIPSGRLVFFDGHSAWYIPCNNEKSMIQSQVTSIQFYKDASCPEKGN